MSSCFSRCLRVPIAIRAFYESYLWILQTLSLTHPDLHPGLLGGISRNQRNQLEFKLCATELDRRVWECTVWIGENPHSRLLGSNSFLAFGQQQRVQIVLDRTDSDREASPPTWTAVCHAPRGAMTCLHTNLCKSETYLPCFHLGSPIRILSRSTALPA